MYGRQFLGDCLPSKSLLVSPALATMDEELYHASVQESAVLYMQCTYADINPKNACGMWSAFLCHFFKTRTYPYVSICTWLSHVQCCLYTVTKAKCHRKAEHMPQAFLRCIYACVHCIYRTADSCTLAWYSAS